LKTNETIKAKVTTASSVKSKATATVSVSSKPPSKTIITPLKSGSTKDTTTEKSVIPPSKVEIKPKKAEKIIKSKAPEVKNIEKKVTEATDSTSPSKQTVRYSDEDLNMFEQRIQDFRHEAIDELRMLRERLDDLTNYDFAEESMIYSMHMAEQGSEAMEKEKTYAQIQRINEYIKKLDDALSRIKDKSYGICRVCNCLIAKERLLAVPITTLSAAYKIHKRCPEDGVDRIEPVLNDNSIITNP
jgi:DnaK suppressor protein